MADQDLEIRRARDLERYHRRTAERRAQGLCLKCEKQPPAPLRSQCEPCAGKKRPADRARHHRRAAERTTQGLCPKCGKQPPAPELSVCAPCAEKKRIAGRVRDAGLRAASKPRRDREKARAYGRQRRRRQAAERRARGLCPDCGKQPPAPDASLCAPCGDHRRAAERARYATGKAAGKLYGGRDPEQRRKLAREKSQRRLRERLEAGLCTHCGHRPPAADGTTCEPCRESRQAAERARYAARRAAGECGRCGAPAPDGSARCERCARSAAKPSRKKAKNARGRRRYVRRRVRGLCIDCAAPAQGAARCPECARRSYLRSDEHRGLPILPPRYTVIEIATGADHGTWDSMAEVAMSLAFARLSREDVEVISDVSPMAAVIGY